MRVFGLIGLARKVLGLLILVLSPEPIYGPFFLGGQNDETGTAAELGVRLFPWVEAHPVNGRMAGILTFRLVREGRFTRAPPILRQSQIQLNKACGIKVKLNSGLTAAHTRR